MMTGFEPAFDTPLFVSSELTELNHWSIRPLCHTIESKETHPTISMHRSVRSGEPVSQYWFMELHHTLPVS